MVRALGLMIIGSCFVAVWGGFDVSVRLTFTVYVPAWAGVPVRNPSVDKLIPVGSPVADQV